MGVLRTALDNLCRFIARVQSRPLVPGKVLLGAPNFSHWVLLADWQCAEFRDGSRMLTRVVGSNREHRLCRTVVEALSALSQG
jgi:hypothetical protein